MSGTAEDLYKRHRLKVEDYHRMGEAGIFDENARVELIDGEIVDMVPIGSLHAGTVKRLIRLLERALGETALLSVQHPVVLSPYSEPEPDIALLKPREDFYTRSHPGPEDVLLIIEVSDTTLRYDREVKVPPYARAGIPEVWLIDLESKQLEIYRHPRAQGYQQILRPQPGERLRSVRLPEVSLPTAELWSES